MNDRKFFVAIGLALILAGCLPILSLNPLFSKSDLIFDPALLGKWLTKDNTLAFEKSGDKEYEVTLTDKDTTRTFIAKMGKLGKFSFLDFSPPKPGRNDLLPAHMIFKIILSDDSLKISFLDDEWLKKKVTARKIKIVHQSDENGLLLTASTAELQKLVVKYAGDQKAFTDAGKYRRQK